MENELAGALEREQATILEIELEKENGTVTSEIPETSTRKKLKRELEREALSRLEDAARTEEDFQNVVTWWNRLDANRERKERYHEIGRSDIPLEWGMSPDEIVIPAPIQHVYRKQIQKGDFLDAVFNCPFEMHELVTDADISRAIFALKDVQKELLYQLAIRGYSCQMIAAFRKQTDRNIRKIRDTMLRKLRKSFIQVLQQRIDNHIPLTKEEQLFYDSYKSLITDKKKM
ncbi:MAG: sigma-70 family RNA polymerase sigma factor [Clostridiales bacterium]|nr:sigma-70 family RNA polymerase sigma factor [Clostridiales bacterium]